MTRQMKVAIASGKGGTGKTTVATNLACLLSQSTKTILADLDVEEPDSGLFIKGALAKEEIQYKQIPKWDESKCTLCGNCQQVCNFNAIMQMAGEVIIFPNLCHSCHACSELCPSGALPMRRQRMGTIKHFIIDNIDFVESRLDVGQEQAVPMISKAKAYLAEKFNGNSIVILDSPPGTSCPVIETVKGADLVLLVTEPTPFGLHDLKLAVNTVRDMNLRVGVIINRYGSGNNDVLDYCGNEDLPVVARINDEKKVAELYSKGELVYDKVPSFREGLLDIVKYLQTVEETILC